MKQNTEVWVNHSQSPQQHLKEWLECLGSRSMRHKFLYESPRQAARWLAVHEAYSPARTDESVEKMYAGGFAEVATQWPEGAVQLIGLGCGGGHKEVQLALALERRRHRVRFVAADVSLPLVLSARHRFAAIVQNPAQHRVAGWVVDIAGTDLARSVEEVAGTGRRLVTFFGMIPNFEPEFIFPKLSELMRGKDHLLMSANLAPGKNYRAGVKAILPLYDNEPTRRWLMGPLVDAGIDGDAVALKFTIKNPLPHDELLRVQADLTFKRETELFSEGQTFRYGRGDQFQIFYSYRYTPENLAATAERYGLRMDRAWVAPSGEEGLFMVSKA